MYTVRLCTACTLRMSRRSDREVQADAFNRFAGALERLERTLNREPERVGSRREGPRRLTFDVMCAAVPGLASQFKTRVPAAFWAQEVRKDRERPVAVVSCPCGGEPVAEMGVPTGCEGCERVYVYDGDHVHVAFSPKAPSPASA